MHKTQFVTNPLHESQYVTNFSNLNDVGCKVLHFINNEDQETLGYKTRRYTNAVASHREKINLSVSISVCDGS